MKRLSLPFKLACGGSAALMVVGSALWAFGDEKPQGFSGQEQQSSAVKNFGGNEMNNEVLPEAGRPVIER